MLWFRLRNSNLPCSEFCKFDLPLSFLICKGLSWNNLAWCHHEAAAVGRPGLSIRPWEFYGQGTATHLLCNMGPLTSVPWAALRKVESDPGGNVLLALLVFQLMSCPILAPPVLPGEVDKGMEEDSRNNKCSSSCFFLFFFHNLLLLTIGDIELFFCFHGVFFLFFYIFIEV